MNSDDLMPNGMLGFEPPCPLKTVVAVIHDDDLKSKPFLNVATCYNCTIYSIIMDTMRKIRFHIEFLSLSVVGIITSCGGAVDNDDA